MGASPGTSVLIVEDVQAIRFHLRAMLQELGFSRIQTAATVEEAQLVLMVEAVDLILCDWYLNSRSGLDLLRELRKTPERNATAFVLLTAENAKEKVVEALKAGVDDYLLKPLSAATLGSKLAGAIAKRRVP